MSTPDTVDALRRANPRLSPGFAASVEAVAARIATTDMAPIAVARRRRPTFVRLAAVAAAVCVAAGLAALTVAPRGSTPGVENAAAVVRKAATVTAVAADRSGTAVVRITHDGELWAGSTIRWNGESISVRNDARDRAGKVGGLMLVVDGTLYGRDPRTGDWIDQGSPANIDPDSGTTPAETLAAVREDVGGVTLNRLARGVTRLTTSRAEGSTAYRGKVAAGLVARETGVKDGQELRVFPFGYVAHDEAANPAALLDAALTVGADGVVRQIALSWGTWTYTVTYSGLGSTPALVAPKNARSLRKERLRAIHG